MRSGLIFQFRGVGGTPTQPQGAAQQRKAFAEGVLGRGALSRASEGGRKQRRAFEEGALRHAVLDRWSERRQEASDTSKRIRIEGTV